MIKAKIIDNVKGFGLPELVAALGVLAIILAVAVPNFLDWRASTELRSLPKSLEKWPN
ncbi:MAG: prepilin-type N-terminal cleavage/methylation domain-containing protein [Desulfobacterales bacterium]|nr:prepilin-type N-terminal cleavage/methylation domain-containing protein [Desulfobacterales bacterium]